MKSKIWPKRLIELASKYLKHLKTHKSLDPKIFQKKKQLRPSSASQWCWSRVPTRCATAHCWPACCARTASEQLAVMNDDGRLWGERSVRSDFLNLLLAKRDIAIIRRQFKMSERAQTLVPGPVFLTTQYAFSRSQL